MLLGIFLGVRSSSIQGDPLFIEIGGRCAICGWRFGIFTHILFFFLSKRNLFFVGDRIENEKELVKIDMAHMRGKMEKDDINLISPNIRKAN